MLYNATDSHPNTMRFCIRLIDDVDPDILREAVTKCMERYPYFTVELVYKDGEYRLIHNSRPVVVTHRWDRVVLCSEMTNYHFTAFSYDGSWLYIDISHAITDGAGIYNMTKTLLYYYCTAKYDADISPEGIMLPGDEISQEEWEHPALKLKDIPPRSHVDMPRAMSLFQKSRAAAQEHLAQEHPIPKHHTVCSISTDEQAFMEFVRSVGGTPGTVVSVLLARAIAACHPDSEEEIRTILSVNMRKALKAPLAHQPLVGGVMLAYDKQTACLSLKEQISIYRKAVAEQTKDDNVIAEAAGQRDFIEHLLSKKTDQERIVLATKHAIQTDGAITAGVSYTGKASYGQIERYIEECRELTNSIYLTPLLELAAMGGRFFIDFIQPFEDERYINAFAKELEKWGVDCTMSPGEKMILPRIRLPWRP